MTGKQGEYIVLKLKGTKEGFSILQILHAKQQLDSYYGLEIIEVQLENSIAEDINLSEILLPTKSSLRKMLNEVLIGDSDVDALCLDFFEHVKKKFGVGMDRTTKINLLLERVDSRLIVTALREHDAFSYEKHKHILRFQPENRSSASYAEE